MNGNLRVPFLLTVSGFAILFIWLFLAIGNTYASFNGMPRIHETLLASSTAFILFAAAIGLECRFFGPGTLRQRLLLTLLVLLQGTLLFFSGFLIVAEAYSWSR